jgi:hypothetical protein
MKCLFKDGNKLYAREPMEWFLLISPAESCNLSKKIFYITICHLCKVNSQWYYCEDLTKIVTFHHLPKAQNNIQGRI